MEDRQGNLVLSRRQGEKIRIGENIVIEITRVQGNVARVAIKAPRDVKIIRDELARR
jgi:carbon storage regulator